MRHRTGLVVLALLGLVGSAAAQPFIAPGQQRGNGLSLGYAYQGKRLSVGLSYNGGYANYGYGRGYPGCYPSSSSYTRIIVYSPPPPPPIIVAAPLAPVDWEEFIAPRRAIRPEREPDPPPPMKKPPEKPREPEKPKEQPPAEKPRLPRPQQPHPNPAVEQERLLTLGRLAFAERLHGLAAERFAQAVEAGPNQPLPWFLLSQAYVALGKYRQAVDAVLSGLARDPDWPLADYQPLQLYGDHPADYTEHLQALEEALQAHPDDPNLLFLQGYQLWFDGRQAEAAPYFQRVLPAFPNKGVERFLHALPGTQIL